MKFRTEERIVKELKRRGYGIGIMESCTGGAIMNSLTNIPGSSNVFLGGLVTYSNEAKIRAGVDEKIIKKFGVYSKETADEMAKIARASVGVGVTGELPGSVYVAVRIEDKVYSLKLKVKSKLEDKVKARNRMKREVVRKVWKMILQEL